MSTQRLLINAAMMASARKMKAVRGAGKQICFIVSEKIAPAAAAPANTPTTLHAPSPDKQVELHMPDEDRDYHLWVGDNRCIKCGSPNARLITETINYQKLYRVECNSTMCGHVTAPCKSSEAAIHLWKMESLLSKP